MPEMSEQAICDFCAEPKIGRRFHCPGFFMDQTAGFPYWLACSACGNLIDAENWNGLLQRAVDKFREKYDMPRRILADRIKQTHDLFRQQYRKAEQ